MTTLSETAMERSPARLVQLLRQDDVPISRREPTVWDYCDETFRNAALLSEIAHHDV